MSMFDGILNRDEQTAEIETDSTDAETDTDEPTVDLSLLDDPEQSILSEPYYITPTGHERAAGTKALTHTDREGDVAGPFIRQMFENSRQKPRQALWLGYDDDPQEGFREAGIPFKNLRRHLWIAGVSGSGKTTLKLNLMTQLAYGGHGFVYVDPKGKDSRQLLRKLPEDRLDDVIWVEPGSREHDRTVQLNFLELPDWIPEAERENAIEDRIENLKAFFQTEGYINIETITETMGRAMLKSDDDYSPIDLYFILLNQERRAEFAETVEDPFIRAFCREIADMDDDTVRPILKRITSWVQNAVIRRIIACRESTIDFREIIEEDKIVIVRTPVTNNDIKRMAALGVIRNVWSAIQQRSYQTDKDPQPFFLFCDEFDDIVTKELDVDSMLARARSMWLSLTLSCQYPTQIADEGDVLDAMENNCDNLAAFKANKRKNARILMDRFRKYDADVLLDTNDYEIWTQLPLSGGQYDSGVKLQTFAPYPPLRPESAIDEIIDESLERYGEEPLTDIEIQSELKFGQLGEALSPEHVNADNIPAKRLLECVYVAVARKYDDPDGTETITNERAHEEFERRTGVEMTQSKFSSALEDLYDEGLEQVREGESKVRLTDDGISRLFEQDTGDAENAGGPEHRYILRECFKTFLGMGADAYLPSQGGEELPDGVADLPINPLAEAETDTEYQQLKATCEEEYGPLYDLSDGKDIAIEAETTTLKKPKQTLTNLRKAVEQGKKCVFACKDGSYDPEDFEDEDDIPKHTSLFEYWGRRGENVIFDTSGRGANVTTDYSELTFVSETTNDDGRIFYNRGREMQIEAGVGALRPDTSDSLQWRERSTGEAVADTEIVIEEKTDNGRILSRFESPEAVFEAAPEAFPAYYEYVEGEYVVHSNGTEATFETKDAMTENFKVIREPFIPEREFVDSSGDTRLPTEDDFMFVIYPDDNNDEYDGPQIYEHGELRPLVPDESNGESSGDTESSTDEGTAPTEDEASSQQPTESDEHDSESRDDGQRESADDEQEKPSTTENPDSGDDANHDDGFSF